MRCLSTLTVRCALSLVESLSTLTLHTGGIWGVSHALRIADSAGIGDTAYSDKAEYARRKKHSTFRRNRNMRCLRFSCGICKTQRMRDTAPHVPQESDSTSALTRKSGREREALIENLSTLRDCFFALSLRPHTLVS